MVGTRRFFIPRSRRSQRCIATIAMARSRDVTAASKIHTDGTFFFGVAVGDYDNDGYPDIYMTGYRHSVLAAQQQRRDVYRRDREGWSGQRRKLGYGGRVV